MRPKEAEEKYILLLRSFDGNRRVKIGAELYDMARHMVEDSVRNQNPGISEEELEEKIKQRMEYDSGRGY
jgi:hypothetical protein